MLPNLLNTNEIKDAAGAEVEFTRRSSSTVDGTEFYAVTAGPATPNTLKIKHAESGTGTSKIRRSVTRFDVSSAGQVDSSKTMAASAYLVLISPIGNMTDTTLSKKALAELMSFTATTGAATTVLFDCSGSGAGVLINGTD